MFESKKDSTEFFLIFNVFVVFMLGSVSHVNYFFLVLLTVFVSLVTLVLFWGKFGSWRMTVPPLGLTIVLIVVLQVVAHNVPGIAFYHEFLDFELPVPAIPVGVVDISFVIPTRDERKEYIEQTIAYILKETRKDLLKEIILVDDNSEEELNLDTSSFVQIIRIPERVGLTNAKILGAKRATGTHLMFLDAHCRVGPYFAERMLARMETVADIVVPQVINIDGDSFQFTTMDGGNKMMFDWTFDFSWFGDDQDDFVPVSSGGILMMSRKFFHQDGQYDGGMLEWGGENIEQSLRTWQCGGRIIVEREAKVGHVFNRVLRPNRVSHTVVERNHARAAFVWLDDSLRFFEAKHAAGKAQLGTLGPGIDARLELRHRLGCENFQFFKSKFDRIFEQTALNIDQEYSVQHVDSRLCLTIVELESVKKIKERAVKIEWRNCERNSDAQRFASVKNSRIRNIAFQRCLERKSSALELQLCDYLDVNPNQNFVFLNDQISSNIETTSFRTEGFCVSPSGVEKCQNKPFQRLEKLYVGI